MVAAYRRGTFGTGAVRGNGLALQQSGVVSLGSVASQGDTNFASNVLLAKTTSVNTATNNTFLDSSSNAFTITRNGTPTQGSFTPYWPSGYWSGYFDDSLSSYLTTTSATAFSFGSGDWTIECWANFNGTTDSNGDALVTVGDSTSNRPISFYRATTNQIFVDLSTGGANFTQIPFNVTLTPRTWYHIAAVRNNNVIYCYVNGTSVGTPTAYSSTLASYTGNVYIGRIPWNPASDLPGYISNLRIVKGTAVYTGAFTPSTTPLTAITNTQLLTCQDNRFKDNSTNALAITVGGTPKIQAFQPFNPPAAYSTSTHGGSGYFNGSTDYLTVPYSSAFNFGTGDFTIEGWINLSSLSASYYVLAGTWTTGTSDEWLIQIQNNNTIRFLTTAGTSFYSATLTTGVWYHIAGVRSGSTITLYVNGASVGSYTNANSIGSVSKTVYIGAQQTPVWYMNGYISNFRIVKGTAVYTAAFTPPTTPLTAIANTSLLASFANAGIYDTTVQNNAVTVGDTQVSTTQYKWAPTSMKFNGSTDWLITQSTSDPCGFGSGNFTIEFWLYLNSTGTQVLFDSRNTSSSNVAPLIYYQSGLKYYTAGLDRITGGTLSTATWYYIALVRSSGTTKLYINGTQTGSNYTDANVYVQQANRPIIGAEGVSVGANPLNGYIQDLRITKGIARDVTSLPITTFANSTSTTYTPAVPDAPIIANLTTVTNTSVKIGYMAPLLNGGSTITSYTAVSSPGGITGTSVTSRSGTITVSGLQASNTYTFAVYATNAVGTSTFSASSKSVTTPVAQLGRIFILSDMDLALTNLVLLNTSLSSGAGILKAKSYALATIYGSD